MPCSLVDAYQTETYTDFYQTNGVAFQKVAVFIVADVSSSNLTNILWQASDTQIDTAMQQLVINSMRYLNKENTSPL
jgi:sugar lactone lactonase YvrE